ncbi:MAG: hypothetical protein NHB15_06335 [Methanosarcina barkeri]|nr:hypothetical protein [Methanosarcina sp. ERenArc_MAG2]
MDVPPSEKGIEEALDCAVKLKDINIDFTFASNFFRTQETLFIILSGQKNFHIIIPPETLSFSPTFYFPRKYHESL